MRLSSTRFNSLLAPGGAGMSQSILWRPANRCPCVTPISGQPATNCPVCGARGWLWGDPQNAWAGISGMKVAREWASFGQWESGDVVVTAPSDSPFWAAGENDRAVMASSTEPFSLVLTRTGAESVVGIVVSVSRVFWIDPVAARIVNGVLPLIAGGTFSWQNSADAPPAGIQYTITGRRNPEYFLYKDYPQDRAHFNGAALPRRMVLRRFDIFGRPPA